MVERKAAADSSGQASAQQQQHIRPAQRAPGSSISTTALRAVLTASAGMPMGSGARQQGHFLMASAEPCASAALRQRRQPEWPHGSVAGLRWEWCVGMREQQRRRSTAVCPTARPPNRSS